MGLLNISYPAAIDAPGRHPISVRGNAQKRSSSKAAALLTRGAYSQYVNTAKGENAAGGFFQHSHYEMITFKENEEHPCIM
jgi:hypothetical protein